MSIQSQTSFAMNVLDAGSLHQVLKEHYPIFQQVAPMSRLDLAAPEASLSLHEYNLPRLWFLSSDLKELFQFQEDRLSQNWRRFGPNDTAAEYPGYEAVKSAFQENIQRVLDWSNREALGQFSPDVAELFYENAVPIEGRRLSEILMFFQPGRQVAVAGLKMAWAEVLTTMAGAIHVHCGITQMPDGEPAVHVRLVARFVVQDLTKDAVFGRFDEVHSTIHSLLPYIFTPQVLEMCA
ncbi:MAG: TIGR04255 family protein [Caulobacter sp.]|nr:TIGR04255 family protein [Caulobacter sp.]